MGKSSSFWYGREPSRDPYFKGRNTTRLQNAIFEAKNKGMDYVRAKYGNQITSQIQNTISSSMHGPKYPVGKVPQIERTTEVPNGKTRTAWDSSRFTGDSHQQHQDWVDPNDPHPTRPGGPPVWKAHQHANLENNDDLAQGNQRPGAQATVISSMIDGLLRQSQRSAGDTLAGMFSKGDGQYYLGARDSSSWGVDPVYAPPGSQLPLPKGEKETDPRFLGPPTPAPHPTDPTDTSFNKGQPGQMDSSSILNSSLGGFGFLAGAVAPGNDVNTTQGSGAATGAPGQGQPGMFDGGQAAENPKTIIAKDGARLPVNTGMTNAQIQAWLGQHGGANPNPPAANPPATTTPPANGAPNPTTPAPSDPNAPPGSVKPGPAVGNPASGTYNPWGFGLGAGGVDASGHPVNAQMGPDPTYMSNATMQAMSLANSYFAPQRLELAYQLGDMETDMRRMAVNLGRQVDDPVLSAKLFKEANQAVRTLDTQQNTFAFQLSEQRRQEEQQNWQFYSSLSQEEYKFSNQLDLAQRTFNLQRYQVMNSGGAATPPVTNAFGPPAANPSAPGLFSGGGQPGQQAGGGAALQGGNLLSGMNPYKKLGG